MGIDGGGEVVALEAAELLPGDRAAGGLDAELREQRGHGLGVVAGDDLGFDLEFRHRREGAADLVAQLIAERDEGERLEAGERRVRRGQPRRAGEHQRAQAARGGRLVRLAQAGGAASGGAQDRLRRAEHEHDPLRAAVELDRTPAPRGAEGHLRDWPRAVRGLAERLRERPGRLVLLGGGDRERAQPVGVALGSGRPAQLLQGEPVGGERAGLVEADHVDVVEGLDGVDVLHDRSGAGDAQRADGGDDGHRQQQPNGDHGGDGRGRGLERLAEPAVLEVELDEERGREEEGEEQQHAQQAPEAQHQRRGPSHDLTRGGRQPHHVGLGADALRLVVAVAGHAEAARVELGAGSARDRLRLAGQQRLVELGAVRDQRPVRHDLVAGHQMQQVALDDLLRGDGALDSVADHGRLWRGERAKAAQPPGRDELLQRGDGDVGGDDGADEEAVAELADGDQREDHRAERDVEEGQRVAADDVAVAALAGAVDVGAALGSAARRLLRAQPRARRARSLGPGLLASIRVRRRLRHGRIPVVRRRAAGVRPPATR